MIQKYDLDQPLVYDGKLDLVKAAIRRLTVQSNHSKTEPDHPNNLQGRGFELFLHTDAPPGSGLGSSSALVVAIIGAFNQWLRLPLTTYEIATTAYQIERVDLGIKGGRQDQFAAAFGGFNLMEFFGDRVIVNPLHIPSAILNELQYSLMLFYTGGTRLSAHILDRQTEGYVQRRSQVVAAMDEVKRLTIETKNALLQGRLEQFGLLLHESWESKKKMAELDNESSHRRAIQRGQAPGRFRREDQRGWRRWVYVFILPWEVTGSDQRAPGSHGIRACGF